MTDFPTLSVYFNSVKSPPPPFLTPEAWKRYPIRAEPPRIGHYREYPTGGFSFCERKPTHVSSINGIQLLKMYRLSSKSLGEQEHPRLERWWEFIKFSGVLGSAVQPTQNQIFASSFRWTLKIRCICAMATFDYNWWNPSVIWGCIYLRNCLQMEPSRGTGLPNDTLKQYKALKRNASHNLSPSHIFSGCLRNRYCLNRTINSESSCLLTDEHGKWKFDWSAQQASKGVSDWEEAGRGGWFDLIPWDKYRIETGKPPQSLIPWQNFSGQRKLEGV